eukprot:scaffold161490_cov33-Prasinocladus_malaysianus.AAC.5
MLQYTVPDCHARHLRGGVLPELAPNCSVTSEAGSSPGVRRSVTMPVTDATRVTGNSSASTWTVYLMFGPQHTATTVNCSAIKTHQPTGCQPNS